MISFWSKVDYPDSRGCWNWLGAKVHGYGQFFIRGFNLRAHRIMWKLFHGDIPDGLFVLHTCDNSPCVNPDHLYIGNNSDNMKDRTKDGYSQKEVMIKHGIKHKHFRFSSL